MYIEQDEIIELHFCMILQKCNGKPMLFSLRPQKTLRHVSWLQLDSLL